MDSAPVDPTNGNSCVTRFIDETVHTTARTCCAAPTITPSSSQPLFRIAESLRQMFSGKRSGKRRQNERKCFLKGCKNKRSTVQLARKSGRKESEHEEGKRKQPSCLSDTETKEVELPQSSSVKKRRETKHSFFTLAPN